MAHPYPLLPERGPNATATATFAELASRPGAAVPLDRCCLLIAAHVRPELDEASHLEELDAIAAGVAEPTVDAVLHRIYDDLGFTGAVARYADPDTSLLDTVLSGRTGIPIALATVLLAVAERVGVPLEGVGLPGHFVVRAPHGMRPGHGPAVYIDPFTGAVLADGDLTALVLAATGEEVDLGPDHLAPTPPAAILARTLRNLEQRWAAAGRAGDVAWTLALVLAIPGATSTTTVSRLAATLERTGRWDEAAALYHVLAGELRGDDVRARATARAIELQARLN